MEYQALACDYDGTLARDGAVDAITLGALGRFLQAGRKLVLVTGRELDELKTVFPHLQLFARVVAENGALLYRPESQEERVMAEAPPQRFLQWLWNHGVAPLSVGRVIV